MKTQQHFKIQFSSTVPQSFQSIFLGYPEPATMVPDLCFVCLGKYEAIPINSIILREALLNSKDFIKNYLRLDITDMSVQSTQEYQKQTKQKQKIKEEKTQWHQYKFLSL